MVFNTTSTPPVLLFLLKLAGLIPSASSKQRRNLTSWKPLVLSAVPTVPGLPLFILSPNLMVPGGPVVIIAALI